MTDLLSAEASADPYPLLAELRTHDPVHYSERHRAWLVTRYDDVSAAFKNPALSSARVGQVRSKMRERSAADELLGLISEWMVVSDPPEHTRLRGLAGNAFKAQRIAAMSEAIAGLVDAQLDTIVSRTEPFDLVAELAYPLPATVIATLLGAPTDDRDLFRDWSDELGLVAFGAGGDARPDRHERALAGLRKMQEYFRGLVDVRRADPGEDMLSQMMAPPDQHDPEHLGDRLSDDELVGMCALLLFAGHETTTNSIANSVLALLRHPDQLARLAADPELVPMAVEELLRYDGPIKVLHRAVLADTEIRGTPIRAGERVHLVLAAADRDPEKFDDPDGLDLGRRPNPHIAFGRGIHACIGAQLARLETRVAVERILARLPGLRLVEEPEWKSSLATRSVERLILQA